MAVDPDLYAQALADLRAIPKRPAPEPEPAKPHTCYCDGSRAAYQQHILRKELVCAASREANRAYGRQHLREYRRARRDQINQRRRELYAADKPRGPRT